MAHEEQSQRYSNSSGGGGGGNDGGSIRSSKEFKQKKFPQRGLGVAQLEKIRQEEQEKKDAAILSQNSIISPTNSSSCLAVQSTNFRPSLSTLPPLSPSDLPSPNFRPNLSGLPSPSPTDLPSPNSIFRPPVLIPHTQITRPNSVSFNMSNNVSGREMGWQAISSSGRGSWTKLWDGDFNLEMANHKLDQGSAFHPNKNLAHGSNTPVLPLPGITPRSQQFQQPCISSMVNVPSETSSSSSVMNFQTEPPLNQSCHGNNYTPLWPEEERMAGMKRSYPFSIDDAPGPSFNLRFPPIPRTDESASCSDDYMFNIEPANPVLREGPSSSSGMTQPNKKKVTKENGGYYGDFLTLAPPKPKHPSLYLSPHFQELPDFDALPHQGTTDDPVRWPGPGRSIQQPFVSFLPSANKPNGESPATISNSNVELVENIDLNLKL